MSDVIVRLVVDCYAKAPDGDREGDEWADDLAAAVEAALADIGHGVDRNSAFIADFETRPDMPPTVDE